MFYNEKTCRFVKIYKVQIFLSNLSFLHFVNKNENNFWQTIVMLCSLTSTICQSSNVYFLSKFAMCTFCQNLKFSFLYPLSPVMIFSKTCFLMRTELSFHFSNAKTWAGPEQHLWRMFKAS